MSYFRGNGMDNNKSTKRLQMKKENRVGQGPLSTDRGRDQNGEETVSNQRRPFDNFMDGGKLGTRTNSSEFIGEREG